MASSSLTLLTRRVSTFLKASRTLYTAESLGIPKYKEEREKQTAQYAADVILNRFKTRMAENAKPESKGLIFTEDLKTMLHVASENEADADVVYQLLKRYSTQKSKSDFIFGPVVMRYFYLSDKPVQALKAFCDPALDGMFDYLSCVKILMSLLYKHDMHDELLAVYEVAKAKNFKPLDLFASVSNIVLASCHKRNTPESYKLALDLVKNNDEALIDKNFVMSSRQRVCLLANLALKQKDQVTAMEMLSRLDERGSVVPQNLKIIALSALDRPEDALSSIRRPLLRGANVKFVPEALQALKESVERVTDQSTKEVLATELKNVENEIQEKGLVAQQSLDFYIEKPLRTRRPDQQGKQRRTQRKREESDSDSD